MGSKLGTAAAQSEKGKQATLERFWRCSLRKALERAKWGEQLQRGIWKAEERWHKSSFSRGQAESQGSVWPVFLTCRGRRDGSPALERNKVSKIQHGQGLGLGCAILGCDFKHERIPPCYREKSGHRETGAGGCAGHWAQLVMALGSSGVSAGIWWATESSQERNRGPWMSVWQRCSCPREMQNVIKSENSLPFQVRGLAMHEVKNFCEPSEMCYFKEIQMDWRKTVVFFLL